MNEEWCCEKLENLKIKENRLSTLNEIRIKLNETVSLEAIITNRLLSAPELYDCLDDTGLADNTEQINIASDILSICMANLTIGTDQSELPQLLRRALTHPRPCVRALALNTIGHELQRQPDMDISMSDELFHLILEALQHDETAVGVPAMAILKIILKTRIAEDRVKESLVAMLAGNETIKCRVYELAVQLAKESPAMLQKVQMILDRAIGELDNDDVLLQVTILEILVSLAEQNHGLLYLEHRNVFEVFSKRVELLDEKPLDHLLVPGIMRFFGKVASTQPTKIITGYPHMLECLFASIQSGDATILPVAYDTLANLAMTNQGKILLEKHYGQRLVEIFSDFLTQLRNLSSDLKNRAFQSLEIIYTVDANHTTDEVSAILKTWFSHIAGGPNMQFLLDFCRTPFPDIKVTCLRFVRAVCSFKWGALAFKQTAGFIEYMLDRKIEFDKEAKYAKFQVVQVLTDYADVFDVQTLVQMRTFVNEGPYFVETQMDVATEGTE